MATTTTSSLPPAALQASRAALSAALADQESSGTNNAADEAQEEGEMQEVDMQAQAENIRTVFSDPANFNVKVRTSSGLHSVANPDRVITQSTLSSLPGLCGSTLHRPKVEIFPKHPCPLSLKHQSSRLLAPKRLRAGWRISNE